MKIVDSRVLMSAKWAAARQHSAKETVQFWTQEQNQSTKENVLVDLSEEGKALSLSRPVLPSDSAQEDTELYLSESDKEKIKLLEHFIYVLTGKRLRFLVPKKQKPDTNTAEPVNIQSNPPRLTAVRPQGWGLKIDYTEFTKETQKLSFSSSGSVTTADGRQINFSLNFNVSQEFVEYKSLSIRAGDALIDPLVINFKNASASLGDRIYSFDIDCDGDEDTIAFTGEGSGFLALDLNGNNRIDDGSELFGPRTGNGFAELAAYDQDKNGWIDENDEIFNRLRIWTLDESGNKTLIALGVAGVGAIYLGNVQSEFALKTNINESIGQIRQTGIFLKETGEVGTIQHVDLAI